MKWGSASGAPEAEADTSDDIDGAMTDTFGRGF